MATRDVTLAYDDDAKGTMGTRDVTLVYDDDSCKLFALILNVPRMNIPTKDDDDDENSTLQLENSPEKVGEGRGREKMKDMMLSPRKAKAEKAKARVAKYRAKLSDEKREALNKKRREKRANQAISDEKREALNKQRREKRANLPVEKVNAEREKSRLRMQLQRQKKVADTDTSDTCSEEDVTDEETDSDSEEEVTDGELEWLEKDLETLIKEEDQKTNTRKMMKKTYFQLRNLRCSKADNFKTNEIKNLREGYSTMQPSNDDFQRMKRLMAEVEDAYNSDSDPDYISAMENNKKRMAEKRKNLTEDEKEEIRRKDRERKSMKRKEIGNKNPTTSKQKKNIEDYYMYNEKEHNRNYKRRVRAERSEAEAEFDKIETAIAVRKYRAEGKEYLQGEIYLENCEKEEYKKMSREKFRRDPYKKKGREVEEIDIWVSYYDGSSENKDVLKKRKPDIFAKIEDRKKEECEISEEDDEESEEQRMQMLERRKENAARMKRCRDRKQVLLQTPIDLPELPKSEYELLRDKNVKELEEMRRACGFFG